MGCVPRTRRGERYVSRNLRDHRVREPIREHGNYRSKVDTAGEQPKAC